MSESFVDELMQLNNLLQIGAIDAAEFASLKRAIISRVTATAPVASPESASAPGSPRVSDTTGVSVSLVSGKMEISDSCSSSRKGDNGPGKSVVQSTLHKFFGRSMIEKNGSTYVAVDCPETTIGWLTCQICQKKCLTFQALIAHRKSHVKTS